MPSSEQNFSLELFPAQREIWFAQEMRPASPMYNLAQYTEIRGAINPVLFEAAIRQTIQEAEAMRARISETPFGICQIIDAQCSCSLPIIDFSNTSVPRRSAEMWMKDELTKVCDLRQGPLFAYALLQLDRDRFYWSQRSHHFINDGFGSWLIVRRVAEIYTAMSHHTAAENPPFRPLRMLLDEDLSYRASKRFLSDREYWVKKFSNLPSPLYLPGTPSASGPANTFLKRAAHLQVKGQRIEQLMEQTGVGWTPVLTAGVAAYVHQMTGENDVVLGFPTASRLRPVSKEIPGMLSNVVPLRINVHPDMTFVDLIRAISAEIKLALRHQCYRGEELCRDLGLSGKQRSVFDITVNMMPFDYELSFADFQSTTHNLSNGPVERLSIVGYGSIGSQQMRIDFNANPEYYSFNDLEEYQERFLKLLQSAVNYPGESIRRLELLSFDARQQLLQKWSTVQETDRHQSCIHELFEAESQKHPDRTALVYEGLKLSYGELNSRANQLAHYLRELGVKPDALVAICLERSFETIIALLAVLKAGGAYVPLDPVYPAERLQFMLEDCSPVLLLTQASLLNLFANLDVSFPILDVTDTVPVWNDRPVFNPDRSGVKLLPRHLAYVIYTSGSTGKPKGVLVEHRNVVRLFSATEAWFSFSQDDIWTLFHSYAFDFSVWEIWGALLYGGSLVIVPLEVTRSPQEFYELLCSQEVTVLNQTPSAFRQLVSVQGEPKLAHCLRLVIFGGEALEPTSLKPWFARECNQATQLVNMYGITETTVHATYRPLDQADAGWSGGSPIGRRLPDLRIYILDSNCQPVPVGVTGELYIGGAGVTRGYLNQPDLTAERFLPDPFADEAEARMYKSGDVGRWLPNGEIVFLGRNDLQIKIRGYRIELGEIEARLAQLPEIRQAVVIAREDSPDDKRLVAYYIPANAAEKNIGAEQLRAYLASKLPEYMLPSGYVRVDSLPLTANGKLDSRSLPAPDDDAYAACIYYPPEGKIETLLARIWAEVLKVERIGRHDNFFARGGNSLHALTVIEGMRRHNMYVEVRSFFKHPVLAELATVTVGEERTVEVPPNRIPPFCELITPDMLSLIDLTAEEIDRVISAVPGGAANVQDIYPLAPLQEGILFHHVMNQQDDPYLLAGLLGFNSRSRLNSYLNAMQSVIDRHDILRTAVMWEGLSQPVQVVLRNVSLPVAELQPRSVTGDVAGELYKRFDPRHHRIDVRQAPMLRTYVVHDAQNSRWLMLLLLHHLVDDNTSLKAMQAEIQAHMLGRQEELPKPVAFRNFVVQARSGVSEQEHESFFRRMLGDIDEPNAPFGLLDIRNNGVAIEEGHLQLTAALVSRLRTTAQTLGVSQTSLFHLAWAQVLARLSARRDVVFGTVLFGRVQKAEGSASALGIFINTLPIRITIGEEDVLTALHRTHNLLSELLHHQHASLVLAQRCSSVPAPTPLFASLLNYRRGAEASQSFANDQELIQQGIVWLRSEERTNYPLTLLIDDFGDRIQLTAQVHVSIGPLMICEFMRTALESLVEALYLAPLTSTNRLEVMPAQERKQVLENWNEVKTGFLAESCIHELFEAESQKHPDRTALVYEGLKLSYGELNSRANQLAHYLRELGVKPDALVAICLERSFETIIALLAVLKAGGAYVPLDPVYPAERLQFMLEDCSPVLLLTQASLLNLFANLDVSFPILDVTDTVPVWNDRPVFNPDRSGVKLLPRHLAYVIYTSGSTGKPKGVLVEHRNVVRLFSATEAWFSFSQDDIWTLFHSYAFDFSVWEIWGALLYGGSLVIVPLEVTRSPQEFYELLCSQEVTVLNQTPSAFRQLVSVQGEPKLAHCLRLVIFGGEALEPTSLKPWFARECNQATQLVNMYGITETTVHATYRPLDQADAGWSGGSPIGRRLPDLRIYILDSNCQPVPVGVTGELYIGGAGVTRGYLNQPDLTAERFLPDPFADEAEARMYKSGDVGRWLPNGEIVFLGRNDLQIKIRGYRIELGEIEARLAQLPEIRQAVVIAREDSPDDKRLVAYYTSHSLLQDEDLHTYLAQTMPEYMIPSAYVRIESMPLTPNGKLDRKALPALVGDGPRMTGYEAPQGHIEKLIAAAWSKVLKLDRVGRQDNFFQIGGHSLLTLQVVNRLKRENIEVGPVDLFSYPTIQLLAAQIQSKVGFTVSDHAVLIRRGSKHPLFFVHDGKGELLYVPLLGSQIDPEIPLYGLPAAVPMPEHSYSILEGAQRMVRMIQAVDPIGPYNLAGWSYGGILAYEVASQLSRSGQIVQFLGLLDTSYPAGIPRFSEHLAQSFDERSHLLYLLRDEMRLDEQSQVALAELLRAQSETGVEHFLEKCRDLSLLPDRFASLTTAEIVETLSREFVYFSAMHRYRAKPISIPVHLFVALERRVSSFSLGWNTVMTNEKLQVIPIPGDHYSMFSMPNISILGGALSNVLLHVPQPECKSEQIESEYMPCSEGNQNLSTDL
jgi:amino acid adenylation domain-containing protein